MSLLFNVPNIAIEHSFDNGTSWRIAGTVTEQVGPYGLRLQAWQTVTDKAGTTAAEFRVDLSVRTRFVPITPAHVATLQAVVANGGALASAFTAAVDHAGPIKNYIGETVPAAWKRLATAIALLVGPDYFTTGVVSALGHTYGRRWKRLAKLEKRQISANFKCQPDLPEGPDRPWLKVEGLDVIYSPTITAHLQWELFAVPHIDANLNPLQLLAANTPPNLPALLAGNGPFTLVVGLFTPPPPPPPMAK